MNDDVVGEVKYTKEKIKALEAQLKRQKALFRLQVSLVDPYRATESHVRQCVAKFQPYHLDEVAEERSLNGLCGYLLCNSKPMTLKAKSKYVDSERGRILDVQVVRRFCSLRCMDYLEIVKIQLPLNKNSPPLNLPLGGQPTVVDKEQQRDVGRAFEEFQVVEKISSEPPSTNFPVPGSKVSAHLVEGYRQGDVESLAAQVKEKKQQKKTKDTESESIAAQLSEQLRELGIHETVDEKDVQQSFDASSGDPYRQLAGEDKVQILQDVDGLPQQEEVREELQEECSVSESEGIEFEIDGEVFRVRNDADDAASFFDVEQIKRDIAQVRENYMFTPLMKILNAYNQWKEPITSFSAENQDQVEMEVSEREAMTASRFQIVTNRLSKAVGPLIQALDVAELTKPMLLDLLSDVCRGFNFSRATPSLTVQEWQILAACMLHGSFSKQKFGLSEPVVSAGVIERILPALEVFAMSHSRASLDAAEVRSLNTLIFSSL